MANVDSDMERATYGPFERFLYLILIPVIFTSILIVVLFSIFDYDVMNTVLRTANKIPVVEKLVPDPPEDGPLTGTGNSREDISGTEPEPVEFSAVTETEQLLQQLDQQTKELERLRSESEDKDRMIAQLEAELEARSGDRIDDEQYEANIRALSKVYADMLPSRAASIMQNLTAAERVLILNEMKSKDQIKILEKMDPQLAAETSIMLKDVVPVKDRQISALQERLNEYLQREQTAPEGLNEQELGLTLASMRADDAAQLLIEMRKTNEQQVIAILRAMDFQSRSDILAAIAEESQSDAARLTSNLQ